MDRDDGSNLLVIAAQHTNGQMLCVSSGGGGHGGRKGVFDVLSLMHGYVEGRGHGHQH